MNCADRPECELAREKFPDQSELVGGSVFPDMPCGVIIARLALQELRIEKIAMHQ